MNRRLTQGCLLMLALAVWGTSCADDTFAVVSVSTISGSLDDVAQLRVHVTHASSEDVLMYPTSSPLHIGEGRPVTLSVEFKGWSGQATFEVEPVAKDGTTLAYGRTNAFVSHHAVTTVAVSVYPGTIRPENRQGGVMSDDGLACAPNAPAASCGAGNRTCGILCSTDQSPAVSMCYVAGSGGPGEACRSNRDCAPGSQCFTLGATGCNVMTCLKFCGSDAECGDGDSFCNLPIPCGGRTFLACSRPCDPTMSSNNGCAAGLGCFVYSGDSTDCSCPGTGVAGTNCTQNAACAPGLSCVVPPGADAGSGTGVCRMVCKLEAPACPSGTSCHPFDNSSNNSSRRLYGFCQ